MEIEPSRNGNGHPCIDHDQLVAQYGWVKTVAKNLVRDPFGADDVAQETVLAALVAPPADAPNVERLRAWLGRVAFNMSQLAARRNARRRTREERVAQDEALASAVDHLAKVSLSEHVVGAVTELEEPYRTAVELRYFEGLSTADIARRTGTTDSAVRKRLWRARTKLRESLEEAEPRGRDSWLAALIALPSNLRRLGASMRLPKLAGGLSLGLGIVAGGWFLATARDRAALERGSPSVEVASSEADVRMEVPRGETHSLFADDSEDGELGISGRRIVVEWAPPPVPKQQTPADASALRTLRGKAIDLQQNALADLSIVDPARPETALGSTGADGTFTLEAALPVTLAVRAAGLSSLREVRVEAGMESWSHVLVAARAIDVRGAVVDEAGRPLFGAELEVVYDDSAFLDLGLPLDMSGIARPSIVSDALGAFDLEQVPVGPLGRGIWLETTLAGYETERRATSELARGLLITLKRSAEEPLLVRGFVHRPNGDPAAGATVRLGRSTSRTDDRGAFELEVRGVLDGSALEAHEEGRAPARLANFGRQLTEQDGECEVELVLGDELESIEGVLLDHAGVPLPDWWIAAFQAEPQTEVRSAEPLALVQTGERGDFRLSDLERGDYSLIAYDPRTRVTGTRIAARAGEGAVQVQLPAPIHVRQVSGTLRSDDGLPLAGALLAASVSVESPAGAWRPSSAAIRADGAGRFEFPVPAGASLQIRVEHPSIGAAEVELGDSGTQSCSFSLRRASFLQVEDMTAREFVVLDESGCEISARGPLSSVERFPLWDGRSPIVTLPPGAHALRFVSEGREVARTSVSALPGELVVVRP